MAATLNSIVNKRVTLVVPLDEDDPNAGDVRVVFKPKALTKRFEDTLNDLVAGRVAGGSTDIAATVMMFQALVVSWDLKWDDTDSDTIQLTAEGLADVPLDVLAGIVNAIIDSQKPDPQTASV